MRLFLICVVAGLIGVLASCGGIGPTCCYVALPDELWADGRADLVSAWMPRFSFEFYQRNPTLMPLTPAPLKERVQAGLDAYAARHPGQDATGYFTALGMACGHDRKQTCETELTVSYWCVHREIRATDGETRKKGRYRVEVDLSAGNVQNTRGQLLGIDGRPACP
jgi:hypothetical protein